MGGPVPPIGAPSATLPGLVADLIQVSTKPVGAATILEAKGRHDPGVLPRAVPMVALLRADHLLRQQGQCSLWSVGNRTRRPGR